MHSRKGLGLLYRFYKGYCRVFQIFQVFTGVQGLGSHNSDMLGEVHRYEEFRV